MFESAHLKLERAKRHIGDLEAVFASSVRDHPDPIRIEHNAETGIVVASIIDPDFPTSLPLIICDAIHNLRVALDHAMWELIGLDGGTQDHRTAFPVRRERQAYEDACMGRDGAVKTPRDDIRNSS
jgi:hypothetical protein